MRVSQREVADTPSRYEEIWFDEADELGNPESSVRHARLERSHLQRPDQGKPTYYMLRPLDGHYYFIDVTYPY